MSAISSKQWIVWDWNGTLLDDGALSIRIINGMLEKRGLPLRSPEEHQAIFNFPVIDYYRRLGFDFEREPFERISKEFVSSYLNGVYGCRLHAGAPEVLNDLRARGVEQIILSASEQETLENLIRHFEVEAYFSKLLGIDTIHAPGKVGRGQEWMQKMDLDPEEMLLIGDTVHDLEVADAMGIDCWLVTYGHHGHARLACLDVPLFEDLASVHKALKNAGVSVGGAD